MKVFVEAGKKRVFAGAVDWPGLARGGKTESDALDGLAEYLPRYWESLGPAAPALPAAVSRADFVIAARLVGGSGTDFGVPSAIADFDRDEPAPARLDEQLERLRGAWAAFDRAAARAEGKSLATGPRGGGRDLDKMRAHVLEADRAYIGSIGAKAPPVHAHWSEVQQAFIEALHAKLRGELPQVGPRGGERWPALYAIRRSAWHALDHAWEIEDRLAP